MLDTIKATLYRIHKTSWYFTQKSQHNNQVNQYLCGLVHSYSFISSRILRLRMGPKNLHRFYKLT